MDRQDLRSFIERLIQCNELRVVQSEVDWNLEAAAIARRSNEIKGKAVLFEKLKDYPRGYSIVSSAAASLRRLAVAFELPPETSYGELLDLYIRRHESPLKPTVLSTGPCKQNVMLGKDIDLLHFPVPMIHDGDGGRYFGTLCAGACKDTESDWVNWGTYRMMVHDRQTMGAFLSPANHGGIILRKYRELNRPMEYACFIGIHPLVNLAACSGVPYGDNEVDVVGGLFQAPVELVKCETLDLLVPAHSEIVIEGVIHPNELRDEGPFGEYPGYVVSGVVPRPLYRVNCITYRTNPIISMVSLGTPVDEGHAMSALGKAAEIKLEIMRAGIPLTQVYVPPEYSGYVTIVGIHNRYHGLPQRAASCVWGSRPGQSVAKVIVVDSDVDPTNTDEVMHALAVKCNPATGIHVLKDATNSPLTPYLPPGLREMGKGGGNVLFDCTWPLDWPKEDVPRKASFRSIFPKEVQDRVLTRWKEFDLD